MPILTTVTQKGQVTIPKALREKIGLKFFDKVALDVEDDFIKIQPTVDILSLAGKLKIQRKKTLLKARERFSQSYQRF